MVKVNNCRMKVKSMSNVNASETLITSSIWTAKIFMKFPKEAKIPAVKRTHKSLHIGHNIDTNRQRKHEKETRCHSANSRNDDKIGFGHFTIADVHRCEHDRGRNSQQSVARMSCL
ncbi:Uncharacterised protein r2_g1746 [Pycnogonum litorale]